MTTQESLNKIASQEGYTDFTALMRNATLAYIADRCQKAMILYAQQFIDAGEAIIGPATDILPDTYGDDLDEWYETIKINKVK